MMLDRARLYAGLIAALLLAGCSFQYHDLSQGSTTRQYAFYGKPAVGRDLCMGVVPGTPIYASAGGGPGIIGYTRDVVAIQGQQIGRWVMVEHYNGLLGWVDGTKLALFSKMHPGHTCIVPGLDIRQRPIFLIQ